MIKRISITGPESTGKSWLAEQLAGYYQDAWVPEYAREYLNHRHHPYGFEDILHIAKGQFKREEKQAETAQKFLFCDTDFLVTHIWGMVKYSKSHPWIETMKNTHIYDLYLLCDTDLPWEPDPLREHPEQRDELLELYINELFEQKLPYTLISGQGQARLHAAIAAINQLQQ
ncbi:MAG: ATP-binding protein [Lentimicrobium sp.]|jgi:NadR type nicotinamide-nucleotide adenylyltransferase|nr:ATP-binding protein [Lentimicrobium sp.]